MFSECTGTVATTSFVVWLHEENARHIHENIGSVNIKRKC